MKKSKHFFSVTEKKKIEERIAYWERQTSGELVVMVVDRSMNYADVSGTMAALVALPVAAAVMFLLKRVEYWYYIGIWIAVFLVLVMLLNVLPSLIRLGAGAKRMNEAVQHRAELAFFQHNLHRTRDASGILFMISIFEKKIRIQADSGILAKIDASVLNGFADQIAGGVRRGNGGEAMCAVLDRAGSELVKHFPVKPDDVNEIPNNVIIG